MKRKTFIRDGSDVQTLLECLASHVQQGLTIIDGDLQVLFANGYAQEILDFPPELLTNELTLEDLYRHNALRGEYGPGDPERKVADRVALTE